MNWSDVLLWAVPAVLVFWAVGAYNRLVRLRAAVRHAYGAVEAELIREAELLASALPAQDLPGATEAGDLFDSVAIAWRSLRAALAQFTAVLAATRGRALDAEAVAALATARDVLDTAWVRVQREGHDLAGAPMPEALQARWSDLNRMLALAAEQFDTTVTQYNAAIRQFPAVLLAWLFGMRRAHRLQSHKAGGPHSSFGQGQPDDHDDVAGT